MAQQVTVPNLSSVSRIHIGKEENWLPQVNLWPPHTCCLSVCLFLSLYINKHTIKKNKAALNIYVKTKIFFWKTFLKDLTWETKQLFCFVLFFNFFLGDINAPSPQVLKESKRLRDTVE